MRLMVGFVMLSANVFVLWVMRARVLVMMMLGRSCGLMGLGVLVCLSDGR
jgi:uncharacterized membrane protein